MEDLRHLEHKIHVGTCKSLPSPSWMISSDCRQHKEGNQIMIAWEQKQMKVKKKKNVGTWWDKIKS